MRQLSGFTVKRAGATLALAAVVVWVAVSWRSRQGFPNAWNHPDLAKPAPKPRLEPGAGGPWAQEQYQRQHGPYPTGFGR